MRSTVISRTQRYRLTSYGNGLAYELRLTDASGVFSVFVQGDDASEFEKQREQIEVRNPEWTAERVFDWLWDKCDYGTIAEPVNP